eukprot:4717279-Prymnesium_polylepis.2
MSWWRAPTSPAQTSRCCARWFVDYETLDATGTNPWDFYDSYLFCLTCSSFTGMWLWAPATAGGKVTLVAVGLPGRAYHRYHMAGMITARSVFSPCSINSVCGLATHRLLRCGSGRGSSRHASP